MNTKFEEAHPELTDEILANYLSGSYTSPLLYDTLEASDSLRTVLGFRDAIEQLLEQDADELAFELICSWFSIVFGEIPDLIELIRPDSELASRFAVEVLFDLDVILEEDFGDEIEDEPEEYPFGGINK